jgi:hypothetical protein
MLQQVRQELATDRVHQQAAGAAPTAAQTEWRRLCRPVGRSTSAPKRRDMPKRAGRSCRVAVPKAASIAPYSAVIL